jgi:hypothetical protein
LRIGGITALTVPDRVRGDALVSGGDQQRAQAIDLEGPTVGGQGVLQDDRRALS